MSHRQKSFFDQKHPAKSKSWKHHYRQDSNSHREVSPPKAAIAAPLIISSKSKSKLRAFEFASSNKMEVAMEKENARPTNGLEASITCSNSKPVGGRSYNQSRAVLEQLRKSPRTPAGRLALADLLGESIANGTVSMIPTGSPDERVLWEHSRSPYSSGQPSSLLPTTKRGKKRARSSSPISSPHPKTPKAKASKEVFDLQQLNSSLKTPAAKAAESKQAMPSAFAHLFETSSPRPADPSHQTKSAALNRSLSCGTEWPTSIAKRRKTKQSSELLKREAGNSGPEAGRSEAASKLSRVNLLMEKVQDSLKTPIKFNSQPGPSSSSPLPDRSDAATEVNGSPLQDRQRKQEEIGKGLPDLEIQMTSPPESRPLKQMISSSSEYGDIQDDDLLEITADSKITANSTGSIDLAASGGLPIEAEDESSSSNRQANSTNTGLTDHHGPAAAPHQVKKPEKANPARTDIYEDDDELPSDDLEELMAEYDDQASKGEACPKTDAPGLDVPDNRAAQANLRTAKGQFQLSGSSADEYGPFVNESEDDLDFLAAEAQASGETAPGHGDQSNTSNLRAIKRYLITNVAIGDYEPPKGQRRPEKVLAVREESSKASKVILLRQTWFDTPCTAGAYVHIIGEFTRLGECVVDDEQNMIILHPDHLISSTVVADSFGCIRRAVLQDRVKATNEASAPQVYGHILHEIFQEAMRANRWDTEWLSGLIQGVVTRFIESLCEIHLSLDQAADYLQSKMPELQAWASLFISAKPRPGAKVKDRNGQEANMSINKLLDVEEHVWSPKYGLKGNIDATVQITLDDQEGRKTLTVPFEVKTGKNTTNASHRAQTALYTLLLSDRYDINVACGILYYMESSDMSRVPAIRHELRHMVMQRNELACYVRDRLQLPPMLKDARVCGRCYAKTPCLIYHKLVDDGNGETSGLKDKFDEAVQHLKPNHQAFFTKWDDLLTKEEREMLKFRRELWTMLSSEREKVGRCFANVIIEAGSAYEEVNAPKINRYRYTLVKAATTPSFSFVESQIGVGEPIVISDEEGHFALANGYVTHVGKSRITVAVDRRLHHARLRRSRFDEGDNQVFAGIMEVKEDNEPPSPLTPQETDTPVLYRLDKDEFSNGMATIRNNLIQLMAHGPFGSREIRSLVVDEKAPVFQAPLLESKVSSHAHLNTDQTRAIEKVMSARNYALVLGMPGTGKTTTISHIICALVAQGKSVLLTSYTHSAVDNILLKMKGERFGILRLGAISKIHPEIQKFAILAAEPKKTMEELQETYQGPQVVATTCLGINHPIFNERIFDYCIVDEASQITLPVCLGPIRMAKTFILVGDHYQLPPLVQNAQAREGGLDVSLFKILSSKHPNSVVNLEHQYRMCAEIMTLSNTLIYSSHLKCGNNAVATQSLSLPNFPRGLHSYHHTPSTLTPSHTTFCPSPTSATCWLHTLLSPSTKACFIDTDALGPLGLEDVAAGSRIVNHAEAKLSSQLVRALLSSGVPGADIGVISVYRSQLALLRHSLRSISSDVEMHTADKFQGRDKDVVILSLVRSNAGHNVGELLRDWRRVNVALTRARSKLLVLGSASTMHGDPLLARFVELMEEKGWLYRLPKEALHDHFFDELVSQGVEEQTGQVLPSPSSSSCSPAAQSAKGPKKPRGPIRGKVNVNKVLGKRGVLRDVLNDVIG